MYRVFEISIFGKCYFDQNILGAPAFVKHREKIYEVQVSYVSPYAYGSQDRAKAC